MVSSREEMNLEGDVVLIYTHDQPSVYARIETIEPDVKKDWYQVTLLMLTIPARNVTWILREEYVQGAPFTMGGQPLRIEGVKRAPRAVPSSEGEKTPGGKKPGPQASAKVIPLNRPKP